MECLLPERRLGKVASGRSGGLFRDEEGVGGRAERSKAHLQTDPQNVRIYGF